MPGYIDTTDPARLSRLTGGIYYDFMIGERFKASGWEVEYFNLESLPRYAKMLKLPSAGIISRRCPDTFNILITTLGCSTLTLGLQRRVNHLGRFTVLICHHFRSHLERTPLRRFLYTWTEKRIVREADFIIAISGSTVRKLEELGRSGHDVLLARPGLNVRLADEPRFREDPRRLLLVGNIEERKGILEAVQALACSNIEDIELYIVGERNFDRGYLEKVEAMIGELGLEERVHITGRLSDAELAMEYSRADVFLLPSYWEGYGMATAEAMAQGLPVISTTAGAIPDMIEDGVSGLLVEPGDPQAIGECIRRLFTEPVLRRNLAEGALRKAALFPSWDDTTALVLEAVEGRMRKIENVSIGSDG